MKRVQGTIAWFAAVALCCAWPWSRGATAGEPVKGSPSSPLFSESFENSRLLERGWYDGSRFTISNTRAFAGEGSLEYAWRTGGTTPASSSGIRHLFEATD